MGVMFETLEPRRLLAASGLRAVYCNNVDFTGRTSNRLEGSVSLAPALQAKPIRRINPTTFSVRWTGMVKAASDETYTFITRNTDGVRLWVNGKLVINSWKAQPTRTHSGTIALRKNKLYDLRLEYYNGKHQARMYLMWRTPTRATAIIPSSRLFAYDFRSANIGDYGWDNQDEYDVSQLIKSWHPDFITTIGDNNYTDGSASTIDRNIGQYFHEYIGNYHGSYGEGSPYNRFFPALGNHDWSVLSTAGASAFVNYFTLPSKERYYDFVQGPVHFFVLDSDTREPDGTSSTSTQGKWLKSKLTASTSAFNVVIFHHAPYSSGDEGSTPHMRWPFKDWGADLVLSGHNHIYERLSEGGLPYIVNGVGGDSDLGGVINVVGGSLVRDDQDHGAVMLQANDLALTVQFQTTSGRVVDTLTIGR